MFDKILIANRGEIAVRIIRSAKDLGFRTVAVFSEADQCAPYVSFADEAVFIGASNVSESYLVIDKLIAAAISAGANAIHPGYGFLSENADFARACADNNITFIGPSAEAIELMGCKRQSKMAMLAAGVPCIPGYEGEDQSDETLIKQAEIIGFPLMVKAAKGGGGRGMRLVNDQSNLKAAITSARSEALSTFGSGELIIEKAISNARHIEIQIFADSVGHIIHLAERDCSVQRRHQKVIEEAPSIVLNDASRKQMGDAAILAVQACDYVGAGTVEFLYDDSIDINSIDVNRDSNNDGKFYFLEMNTRLQVEHPVTELVTGLDLVALQLNVANGEPLPINQQDVTITGHAIEVRLYAEDPANNFMPQTGKIHLWQPALTNDDAILQSQPMEGIRVDSGITQGQVISAFYDPMLAKLIAYGSNREQARRRLVRLVQDTQLLGVRDNRAFLNELLSDRNFIEGNAKTNFITEQFSHNKSLTTQQVTMEDWLLAAVLLKSKIDIDTQQSPPQPLQPLHTSFMGQQLMSLSCEQVNSGEVKKLVISQPILNGSDPQTMTQKIPQKIFQVTSLAQGQDSHTLNIANDNNDNGNNKIDPPEQLAVITLSNNKIRYLYRGVIKTRSFVFDQNPASTSLWLSNIAGNLQFFDHSLTSAKVAETGSEQVTASMDGVVVDVLVKEGDPVACGDVIAIIDAMKMEHMLKSSIDGHVEKVLTTAGNQVKAQQLLVQLKQFT